VRERREFLVYYRCESCRQFSNVKFGILTNPRPGRAVSCECGGLAVATGACLVTSKEYAEIVVAYMAKGAGSVDDDVLRGIELAERRRFPLGLVPFGDLRVIEFGAGPVIEIGGEDHVEEK